MRPESRQELADRYRVERGKGARSFVRFIYNKEIHHNTLQGWETDRALDAALITYLGCEEEIVTGLIDGDLPCKYADVSTIEHTL